ncbi:hypothetical protein HF086_003972 [Spodoptera exigua]|uniref:VWFC domain-containing protein n=1 Tax=Spodoptera exigua TaxID=7107 RepID=A0A922M6J3_SPOEX|nr:hypothetical protein HF086_003972 [Spodoptera exigua]
MDRRRAAGALLALAACIACSAAAPTASNQTALDLYENAPEGCFYNFQHYGEGDRIMTNEPCLNCTCHNRMLMCYLRVCPFTKAIGQDCTVEKRDDQCCPIVTCPDVPVDLLTSTSTTSPAEYGATGIGKQDKYGCSINGRYFPEGSKVPPTPNKPCEHCYCIRNMTTCVMQECTLHVDGCTPIYHKDVCCPIRYSCDHEDEVPLLDDMTTTVRPTPGFLLTTTTMSPVTQMTQDCVHDDQIFSDGALIKTEKACQHCYCMKGDIVCVVQECGAPMENEGKNCTSLPPREGQCCPDTYICEGDELTSDLPTEPATDSMIEQLTTLSPPRRTGVEGSGYRNEPDEAPYTEMPTATELEGSGEEPEPEISKPLGPKDIITTPGDEDQYIFSSTKAPDVTEDEKTTPEINKNIIPDEGEKTDESHGYGPTTSAPISEEIEKTTSKMTEEEISKQSTKAPEVQESTTDLGEEQNTVPDVIPEEEIGKPHEHVPSTTNAPVTSDTEADVDKDSKTPEKEPTIDSALDETLKETTTQSAAAETVSVKEQTESDITRTTPTSIEGSEGPIQEEKESSPPNEVTSEPTGSSDEEMKESSKPDEVTPETTSSSAEGEQASSKPDEYVPGSTSSPAEEEKESSKPDEYVPDTTSSPAEAEKESSKPNEYGFGTTSSIIEGEKESSKPEEYVPGTTSSPAEEEKESSKPDEYAPETTRRPGEDETEISPTDEYVPVTTSSPGEEEKEISKLDDVASGTTSSPVEEKKESSKPDEVTPETTSSPAVDEQASSKPDKYVPGSTSSPAEEEKDISKPDEYIPGTTSSPAEEEKEISKLDDVVSGITSSPVEGEQASSKPDEYVPGSTSSPVEREQASSKPDEYVPGSTSSPAEEEKESPKPDEYAPTTTSSPAGEEKESSQPEELTTRTPLEEEHKLTTEPDHGENTVVIADEQSTPHSKPAMEQEPDTITKEDVVTPQEHFATESITKDSETTAEPDRGMNTIPGDINEDATKEPITTGHLDSMVTKGDQSTVTTEPSFRKEDEIASTEKSKEIGSTTIKPEFVDEGLIPTSAHDEKTVTSSDLPTIEDEFTTSVPEYVTEIVETLEPKQTTTESTKETSLVTEMLPEKSPEHDSAPTTSTEKSSEVSVGMVTHEESSRIPGEGDCLLNGVTYRNNSVVPSTNNCHTGCRCASSIIKCDPIICSPPPDYMDNCQSIYDSPDSCCPTFVCDHPRETVPPQSDNQMSGTESPMPSPTIECRGDQCELSEPTKQPTGPLEPCTSENCINEGDHKPDVECEAEGCKGIEHKPDVSEDCANGKCQLPQTDEQVSQQSCKPGEECKEVPSIVTPCEGELCNKIDCGPDGCDQSNIPPQPDKQPELCNEEEGCKPQDIPSSDCTGEEPCRRKEISGSGEKLPSTCEGPNCITEKETIVTEGLSDLSTESPKPEKSPTEEVLTISTTEKTGEEIEKEQSVTEDVSTKKSTTEEELATETPTPTEKNDLPTTGEGNQEKPYDKTEEGVSTSRPTVTDEYEKKPDITEREGTELPTTDSETDTEKSVIDESSTQKPAIDEEKDIDVPTVTDQESTDVPTVVNIETEKPSLIDDKEKPTDTEKDTTEASVTTEKVNAGDDEGNVKPSDNEDDNQPDIDDRVREPELTDTKTTNKPAAETEGAEISDVTMQEITTKASVTNDEDKELTKTPIDQSEKDVETSTVIDKDGTDMEPTEKPGLEEEMKPHSEQPAIDKMPSEEDKNEIASVGDENTEKTATDSVLSVESSSTPASVEVQKGSEFPSITTDVTSEKPLYVDEDQDKPVSDKKEDEKKPIDRDGTELPAIDASTEKPYVGDEDNKETPIIHDINKKPTDGAQEDTIKPFIDGESTALPDFTEKESTGKPVIIDERTEEPVVIEKQTSKPVLEEGKDKPDIIEKSTEETTVSEMYTTRKPDHQLDGENQVKPVDESDTEKPILVEEKEKPVGDKEADKEKPVIIDEDITDQPNVADVNVTDKPKIHEEEGSGSEGLETTPATEIKMDEKLPETSVQTTEVAAVTEIDKITNAPVLDSQTTAADLNAETMDIGTSSESPINQVSDSEESKVTDGKETSQMPETATDSSLEPEVTTSSPEAVTITKQQEQEDSSSTVSQDLSSESLITKAPELHATSKPIGEEEDISTDSPDIELPSTKLPETGPVIIEPQEGFDTESPEIHVTVKPTEESATKDYEKNEDKLTPESHVTEASSALPELDTSDKEHHTTIETTHDDESKTQRPDLTSSEKEEMVTEPVTEPIRRFTEIEDPSVTGQGDVTTSYPEASTEHRLPFDTDKLEETDVGLPSSEKPIIMNETMQPEIPITKNPEYILEEDKEKPTINEFELPTTEKSLVTDSQEISHVPEEDTSSFEQTTAIPELSEHKHKDTTSFESETTQHPTEGLSKTSEYVTEPYQETSTKLDEKEVSHAQPSDDIEHETKVPEAMPTESLDEDKKEPSVTEIEKQPTEQPLEEVNVQTEMPGVKVTSEVPESLVTEQKETINEQVTVSSVPQEESSQEPELMTTLFEEISKVPDVQDVHTEVPVHITESVEVSTIPSEQEKDYVTRKQDTDTTLQESPTATEKLEPAEVTKITEHTSPQTEYSETTPYLIELEEHTHKIVDDTTTVSPSDEEHSYKPVEDISIPTPADDEHSGKPVEESSTKSPSEEDHSNVPIEGVPTSSTAEEDHSYKPVEEGSTFIPSEEEHSLKPVEEVTTSLPTQEEHSYKPELEASTSSPSEGEHSYKPLEEGTSTSDTDEEHSDKPTEEVSTSSPSDEEHSYKPVEETSSFSPSTEDFTSKDHQDHITTALPSEEKLTTENQEGGREPEVTEFTTKLTDDVETQTKPSGVPQDVTEKAPESTPVAETTPAAAQDEDKYDADHKESTTSAPVQIAEETSTPAIATESEKLPSSESDNIAPTEKETSTTEKPSPPIVSQETTTPEEEILFSTTKATTIRQGDEVDDKFDKPDEKPIEASEIPPSSTTTESSKPSIPDLQSTDELPSPGEDEHFPPGTGPGGYGEPDYVEEDQAFGPGTCRYGGKVYVSAQQIPRDDPCDFCFCFRSDIICLQQSCPPPIHGCHEEPIQGFCCPRYECPVSMATTVNVTTTTTTTTTTLPPHFPTHSYKGAAQRRGCQIKGHTYKVGEVVRSSSGPCLHCTCGGDGQMKCDPKACTPEPMLRQMIAAAVSAKRRR